MSEFILHVRASSVWVRAGKHKINTLIHAKGPLFRHRSDVILKMEAGDSIYARLGNKC